jgi:quercetin dioxygenase-like cupin family protein
MSSSMENYIARTGNTEWKELKEEGVATTGLFVKALRFDPLQKRSPAILLKFSPGSSYPYHNHPAGEEIFVLNGSCRVNETILNAGDYLYTPPGFKHGVKSDTGCEMLLIIPAEVEILEP